MPTRSKPTTLSASRLSPARLAPASHKPIADATGALVPGIGASWHEAYLDRPLALKFLRAQPNPLLILAVDNDATRKVSPGGLRQTQRRLPLDLTGQCRCFSRQRHHPRHRRLVGPPAGQPVGVDPRICFSNIASPR
jgi:hypothetical protein